MRTGLRWLLVPAVVVMATAIPGAAQEKKAAGVVITSPTDGQNVEQSEQVEGQLRVERGWPVVFVKALTDSGQAWWVQSAVDEVSGGNFAAQCTFGTEDTKPGTKFRIVVVLARTKEDAGRFEAGKKMSTLPPGLPRSEPLSVTRK